LENQLNFNWSPFYEDIGIFGKKGEGKTTRAKQILDTIPNLARWIWSPQRPLENYQGYGHAVTSIDDLKHGAYIWAGDYTKKNFLEFCDRAFHHMRNIVLVIDDVHEQVTKQFIPPQFDSLVLSGRNRGISSIFISPYPAKVHNSILSQCSHIFDKILRGNNKLIYSLVSGVSDSDLSSIIISLVSFTSGSLFMFDSSLFCCK